MKKIMTMFALCLMALAAEAQETVMMRMGNIVSPEVNNDGTVTLRLLAPKANKVTAVS